MKGDHFVLLLLTAAKLASLSYAQRENISIVIKICAQLKYSGIPS